MNASYDIKNGGFDHKAEISPEAKAALSLISAERAIVKVVDSRIYSNNFTKDNRTHYFDMELELKLNWEFFLDQCIAGPNDRRPVKTLPQNADRNQILDEKKLQWVSRESLKPGFSNDRGRPKDTPHLKKTAGTLLPDDAKMVLFNNTTTINVGILYDIDECKSTRYIFEGNAGTNFYWWIFQNSHTIPTRFLSLAAIREKNKKNIEEKKPPLEWNELLFKFPKKGIKAVFAVKDEIGFRLNALHKKYLIQDYFKRKDWALPVLVITPEQGAREYNFQQQREDIAAALKSDPTSFEARFAEALPYDALFSHKPIYPGLRELISEDRIARSKYFSLYDALDKKDYIKATDILEHKDNHFSWRHYVRICDVLIEDPSANWPAILNSGLGPMFIKHTRGEFLIQIFNSLIKNKDFSKDFEFIYKKYSSFVNPESLRKFWDTFVKLGRFDLILWAMQRRLANFDQEDEKGNLLLHCVAREAKTNWPLMETILLQGKNVFKRNRANQSALDLLAEQRNKDNIWRYVRKIPKTISPVDVLSMAHLALDLEMLDLVQYIFATFPSFSAAEEKNPRNNLLHRLVDLFLKQKDSGSREIISELFKRGYSADCANAVGDTPASLFIQDPAEFRWIVKEAGNRGLSPEHRGALFNLLLKKNMQLAKDLLDVSPCMYFAEDARSVAGNTPLHRSFLQDSKISTDMVKKMLRAGVSLVDQNDAKQTPVDLAIQHGYDEAIHFLVEEHALQIPVGSIKALFEYLLKNAKHELFAKWANQNTNLVSELREQKVKTMVSVFDDLSVIAARSDFIPQLLSLGDDFEEKDEKGDAVLTSVARREFFPLLHSLLLKYYSIISTGQLEAVFEILIRKKQADLAAIVLQHKKADFVPCRSLVDYLRKKNVRLTKDLLDIPFCMHFADDLNNAAGNTPLHRSFLKDSKIPFETVKKMIRAGVSLADQNDVKQTPVDLAVQHGYEEAIQFFIEECAAQIPIGSIKALFEYLLKNGKHGLFAMWAQRKNKLYRELQDQKAQPMVRVFDDLSLADERLGFVEPLLSLGADFEEKDEKGDAVLVSVARKEFFTLLRSLLLKHHAVISTNQLQAIFEVLVRREQWDLAALVVQHKKPDFVLVTDWKTNETPLHQALVGDDITNKRNFIDVITKAFPKVLGQENNDKQVPIMKLLDLVSLNDFQILLKRWMESFAKDESSHVVDGLFIEIVRKKKNYCFANTIRETKKSRGLKWHDSMMVRGAMFWLCEETKVFSLKGHAFNLLLNLCQDNLEDLFEPIQSLTESVLLIALKNTELFCELIKLDIPTRILIDVLVYVLIDRHRARDPELVFQYIKEHRNFIGDASLNEALLKYANISITGSVLPDRKDHERVVNLLETLSWNGISSAYGGSANAFSAAMRNKKYSLAKILLARHIEHFSVAQLTEAADQVERVSYHELWSLLSARMDFLQSLSRDKKILYLTRIVEEKTVNHEVVCQSLLSAGADPWRTCGDDKRIDNNAFDLAINVRNITALCLFLNELVKQRNKQSPALRVRTTWIAANKLFDAVDLLLDYDTKYYNYVELFSITRESREKQRQRIIDLTCKAIQQAKVVQAVDAIVKKLEEIDFHLKYFNKHDMTFFMASTWKGRPVIQKWMDLMETAEYKKSLLQMQIVNEIQEQLSPAIRQNILGFLRK